MDLFWLGGEGPRDIPPAVYTYLIITLKVPWDNLNGLRSVQKVGFWDGKLVTFVRIYNPLTSEEASQVKDFTYLDHHQELILYEGYWEKDRNRVYMECKAAPKPQSQ